MWKKKQKDVRGVAGNTKSQEATAHQQEKVDASAWKYQSA